MAISLTRFRVLGLHGRRNLDVEVQDNKLILVGENGTGKSTFATLVYYFLTRQWTRTRNFRFESIEATLNGTEVAITPDLIDIYLEHSERLHVAGRRFPPHIRHLLFNAVREQGIQELLEDRWMLGKTADELGLPISVVRDYILRYWKDSSAESPDLAKVNEVLTSLVSEQVLFLPTDLPPRISASDNLESPVIERGFSNEEDEAQRREDDRRGQAA